MKTDLDYSIIQPHPSIAGFVESFWMLYNPSDNNKDVVVLPDGRIDIFLSQSATEPFDITLMGLGTEYAQSTIVPKTLTFAISFKPLAAEYVLHQSIAHLCNQAERLPDNFWGFSVDDMNNFGAFSEKASEKIKSLLTKEPDDRKLQLFHLIYTSNGSISVKELSEKVFWSSRQINRYFNQQYGMSLKEYGNIIRFRASLQQIADGIFYPEQNFADQSHFIKEIKKLSGVAPKELNLNKNDRFIQLSALDKK
ncbi:MAG: AraC family transcriptional regulator [Agriterribacter sp.]